ncbi:hypothetical protein AB4Z48_17810 [Cupriavidus sp. 2TAF22]|uniref:hypothetical protein n=1 Tax=unclassified Cupriavidus TaxID=2640874 RepID=UPI003F92C4F5
MNAKARRNAERFGTSIGERLPADHGLRLAAPSRGAIRSIRPHTDDLAVDQLATAMKAKLAACRSKGRAGWDNPLECSVERLAQMMAEAVCKGDPIDVANFAAMLHARAAAHQVVAEHAARALLRGNREACAEDRVNACRYQAIRDLDHSAELQAALRIGGSALDSATDQTITNEESAHA